MGVPPHLRELYEQALARWVPTWVQAFTDCTHGGFHERLDFALRPLPMGYKRLLTQCRQIYVYSQAYLLTEEAAYVAPLRAGFAFLRQAYHRPRLGGWVFSVTPEGAPCNSTFDLYGHAFVVLALSFYVRATGEAAAHKLLSTTLHCLDTHFRTDAGFFERLREDGSPVLGVRRQNSHMHLFEACLMANALVGEPVAKRIADEVLALFFDHFFDAATGTLVEFFLPDWSAHPELGDVLEPGHHDEWIWLLHRYAAARPMLEQRAAIAAAINALAAWSRAHAWDGVSGGIFDQVRRSDGVVLKDSKRIWHVTEALKASTVLTGPQTWSATQLAAWLRTYVAPQGLWIETKQRNLTPATRDMPGTTPYHLLMGVCEANRLSALSDPQLPHAPSVGG